MLYYFLIGRCVDFLFLSLRLFGEVFLFGWEILFT